MSQIVGKGITFKVIAAARMSKDKEKMLYQGDAKYSEYFIFLQIIGRTIKCCKCFRVLPKPPIMEVG